MEKDILPQGDRIRQLLTSASISSAHINNILRDKGVFLGNNEKNNSIPLLMKALVSPREFSELYEAQKKKEDTVKFRTATIKCNADINLADVFSVSMDLEKKIQDAHKYQPNFNLIGTPNFYIENDTAVFEYQIERENLLEDWMHNKSIHTGKVYVRKVSDGALELSVEQNSTSRETIQVNELITEEVKRILKDRSLIKTNEDFIRIKFNDFSNAQRIQFLYSFTSEFCIYLDYQSITDIDLYLDESQDSHADIKPFLDEIESLKIKGKGLQNNLLLKNKQYHDKLIVASIALRYKFDVKGVKGFATIIISFPDYITKRAEDAELQISINFVVDKEDKRMATEAQLRKDIYTYVEKNKISNYPKYKTT